MPVKRLPFLKAVSDKFAQYLVRDDVQIGRIQEQLDDLLTSMRLCCHMTEFPKLGKEDVRVMAKVAEKLDNTLSVGLAFNVSFVKWVIHVPKTYPMLALLKDFASCAEVIVLTLISARILHMAMKNAQGESEYNELVRLAETRIWSMIERVDFICKARSESSK